MEPGNVCDAGNAPYRKSFSLTNWNLSRRSHHIPAHHIIVKSLHHRHITSSSYHIPVHHIIVTSLHHYHTKPRHSVISNINIWKFIWSPCEWRKFFGSKRSQEAMKSKEKGVMIKKNSLEKKLLKLYLSNDIHSDLNAQPGHQNYIKAQLSHLGTRPREIKYLFKASLLHDMALHHIIVKSHTCPHE